MVFQIVNQEINYNPEDDQLPECYKVIKITRLNDLYNNIWFKAGLLVGDSIIGIETPRGTMGYISCEESNIDVEDTFRIMFNTNAYEEDGFWVERIRFGNNGGFSLKDIQVRYE